MRLICLGTGGYFPNDRRQTACLLLPEAGIVLDAGSGFYRTAQYAAGRQLSIFLSHAHLDHIMGLTSLLGLQAAGRLGAARIFAVAGKLEAVRNHLFAEAIFPARPECEFLPLSDRVELPEDVSVAHCKLEHPGGSTGFRVDGPDWSMAYITDTTAPGEYAGFIRGVDLLIHECQFPDEMAEWARRTGHSHTTAVAQLAADARVGRLLLTHMDPLCDEDDPIDLAQARRIFPNVEIATDGLAIDF